MKSSILKNISLPLVTILIVLLFVRLSFNKQAQYEAVEQGYISGTAVNLSRDMEASLLAQVLYDNNYISNETDAHYAADHISQLLAKGVELSSLGELDKYKWQIPAAAIDSAGSPLYRERLASSRSRLECDSMYNAVINERNSNEVTLSDEHEGSIVVKVKCADNDANFLMRKFNLNSKPCHSDSLVVRLARVFMDEANNIKTENIAYAMPDEDGIATFKGLNLDELYSVLPIRQGYEYGVSKGTVGGSLASQGKKSLVCTFTEKEHRVKVFDIATMKQIKEDHAVTVRTPQMYRSILVRDVVIVLLLWWALIFYFNRKQRNSHSSIIGILMMLTGISLLTMYSINDPLTDTLLGTVMMQGISVGILLIGLFLNIDFTKFYRDLYSVKFDIFKWLFLPYKKKVSSLASTLVSNASWIKKGISLILIVLCLPLIILDLFYLLYIHVWQRWLANSVLGRFMSSLEAKGIGYALLAILLTILLFTPLGSEVGGMKVNLNLGIKFQPSEIAKYLTLIFMASFFCVNSHKIMAYSAQGNAGLFGEKLRMMLPMILCLLTLLILYFFLGDMGPAMVLAFTFIIVYSIIKSKVSLDEATKENRVRHILTCDIAMLVYGVVSFIVMLMIGKTLGNMAIFAILWLILWLILGMRTKQIFETPIFFNAIITVFIFGGTILSNIPNDKCQNIAERLDSRMEMCTNTWGTLPLDNKMADAGENTQVVEGLWGLASGGFWGEGLGNGSPYFIPAFHTDMIIESIGEQMGFVGIVILLLLVCMLLRRTIITGYQSSHPFAFYLCVGIAVVTAVQFVIIALGSTGIIPLTGVTVPFLSYGRVSMILNLAAYGIVLSISLHNRKQYDVPATTNVDKLRDAEMVKYEFPITIVSMVFVSMIILIGGVFFYYQCIQREATLIRPVYVNNIDGAPTVEYNPRITLMTSRMPMGDIYDRNGVLLATSDRKKMDAHRDAYQLCELDYNATKIQRRYYPFGNNLFYILGDFNSRLLFSTSRGYMAEVRHLSLLRGYDNVLRENGQPVKIMLKSKEYRPSRFHAAQHEYNMPDSLQLRDYSALYNNEPIIPQDVTLTIDAVLQTQLQQNLEEYIERTYNAHRYNKLRVSIVMLDAKKGDLLTSAVYPLPDYDRLRNEEELYYSDYNKTTDWKAYTDMDLGLLFSSAPGSTAKVMTSIAGMRHGGVSMGNQRYMVYSKERIFLQEKAINFDMKLALRHSSNVYFIKLANDKNLYADMAAVYGHTGVSVDRKHPYMLEYVEPGNDWISHVTAHSEAAVAEYRAYNASNPRKMNYGEMGANQWSWSWGQGTMVATPLAMARVVSIVANGGKMPVTRYAYNDESEVQLVEVISEDEAEKLKEFLQFTAAEHDRFADRNIGGKTGTPERNWTDARNVSHQHYNDGWYICYLDNTNNHSAVEESNNNHNDAIAVAIRIERLGNGYSNHAVNIMKKVVIPQLRELNYY